ncbi:MAG: NAD-dependent epimerase/dehydratase family protein [Candidatus Margulisiibacteriota bacterium]
MSNNKEIVLVTGISGWIAQFCAVELINAGYFVRGSLRTMNRQQEVINALSKVVDTTNSLEFCELDLLKDDGWDDAMAGCTYVMHIASPFYLKEPKNENELIEPAKMGTLRALISAKKAGVKRVVLTSSIAAIFAHLREGIVTPATWTDINGYINTYQKSKTVAEQAAWDFINNQTDATPMELTVVNPGGVMGPTLNEDIESESLSICKKLFTGEMPGIPNLRIPMVDVRDVAEHHLKAMIMPDAKNKRIISSHREPTEFMEFAMILKEGGYKVPTNKVPTFILKILALFDAEIKGLLPLIGQNVTCDNSETIQLFNWTPRPLKQSFLDMAQSVKAILEKRK